MKILFGFILAATLLFGGYLLFRAVPQEDSANTAASAEAVTIVDGRQIIEIRAKGGYWPKTITAQSGIPTVLRVNTSGTFDCSSALRIASLQVNKSLPANGVTDIDLGTLEPGIIDGNCSMGMYPFKISVVN